MKALVLKDIGRIEYTDVKKPEPKDGEVLLKVRACGICSSDRSRIFRTGAYHFPLIPGHEIAGEIAELGRGVNPDLLGKRAAVFPLLPCRQCASCKEGHYALCEHYNYFGSRCDGGFAEYLAVPVFNINVFPDTVDYPPAAMCEPSAVALHALKRGGMKEGDSVAIVGTGTVGLLAAKIAKICGASNVIVVGRSKEKIKFASSEGADHVVNDMGWDPADAVKQLTYGKMADVVLECAGSSSAAQTAVTLAKRGGNVVFTGNPEDDMLFGKDVYWKILRNELNIRGTWNSSYSSADNNWHEILHFMADGKLKPETLITHRFGLKDCEEAFAVLNDPTVFSVKIMFTMGERDAK